MDSFRFDIMGHHPKQGILDALAKVRAVRPMFISMARDGTLAKWPTTPDSSKLHRPIWQALRWARFRTESGTR